MIKDLKQFSSLADYLKYELLLFEHLKLKGFGNSNYIKTHTEVLYIMLKGICL